MRFDTILIANRGEIAERVLRTASVLGYKTVAVYSEADADLPHVAQADMAVCIGPAASSESYLNVDAILDACIKTGAGAIHPGYGFLSENADFSKTLAEHNITFIGPPANAIEAMGNKAQSKRLMIEAGVPCVPGYNGEAQDDETLISEANRIGFPLMVKASAGGGGKGMRLVHSADDVQAALSSARNEAINAFGNGELLLERAVQHPRHVEIQVFADEHGQVVHMGERDCSIQRRHQKVIEEAPSPALNETLRAQMGQAAVDAARAIGYVGAGTVEFLLGQDGEFYFLEMNTRLQVEHPVTEEITGLDLVALQLQVAQGEPLGLVQEDIQQHGHAMEARLYAEDPLNHFLPQTGHLALWRPPTHLEGVRVDHNLNQSHEITPHYDPMIAKIIAHGATRQQARRRLIRALECCDVLGTTTNRGFLIDCLRHDVFARGDATTAFIADHMHLEAPETTTGMFALAAVVLSRARMSRAHTNTGWSSNAAHAKLLKLADGASTHKTTINTADGEHHTVSVSDVTHTVRIITRDDADWRVELDGVQRTITALWTDGTLWMRLDGRDLQFEDLLSRPVVIKEGADGKIKAPMTGKILQVSVEAGQRIDAGQPLAVLEAMKMEHNVSSPVAGVITEVFCAQGEQVEAKSTLFVIDVETEES